MIIKFVLFGFQEITPSSPASVTNTNSSSSSNSEIKPSPVKRAKLENIIRRDNFPGLRMNADVDRPSQILANHMSLIASRPYEALFSRNLSEPPQEVSLIYTCVCAIYRSACSIL